MIINCLGWEELPFTSGQNIRDWLHVSDHCSAIRLVCEYVKLMKHIILVAIMK